MHFSSLKKNCETEGVKQEDMNQGQDVCVLWVEAWAEHRREASKADYYRMIQNKGEEGKGDKNQSVLVKQQGWKIMKNHLQNDQKGIYLSFSSRLLLPFY